MIPQSVELNQSATSGANGDNMLSQTSTFGDYIIGAPSWVKSSSSTGLPIDNNALMLIAGFAFLGLGIYLWKSKK